MTNSSRIPTADKVTAKALYLLERDINVRDATVTELKQCRFYRSRIEMLEKENRILKVQVNQILNRLGDLENKRFVSLNCDWSLLTSQQLLILQHVAEGLTNKEIALRIGRKPGTVKSHIFNACKKLGVTSRSSAIAECYRRGLFTKLETPEEKGLS